MDTTTDSEMRLEGGASEERDLKEMLVVLDKWTRTCDMVLMSLDDQIKKIVKTNEKMH